MTTRIFLIRHGATELSAEDRFAGDTDVALCFISHKATIRLLLSSLLGFDPRTYHDHLNPSLVASPSCRAIIA